MPPPHRPAPPPASARPAEPAVAPHWPTALVGSHLSPHVVDHRLAAPGSAPARAVLACAFALGMACANTAWATARSSTGPDKASATAQGKAASKAGVAAKRVVEAGTGKAARPRGPAVIYRASPPPAKLPLLQVSHVHSGCKGLHDVAGLVWPLAQLNGLDGPALPGPTPQPEHVSAAGSGLHPTAGGCRHFAAIAPAGQHTQPSALAVLPAAGATARPGDPSPPASALMVTRDHSTAEADTRWIPIDPLPAGLRETWLPATPTATALEAVPPVLHTELLLLLKQLRREIRAPDTTLARVWLLGDDADASMPALELVEPATGQALVSTVWLPRAEGGGAYISSNGIEVERMLWQSPVDHLRISRGVGASNLFIKRRTVLPGARASAAGRKGQASRVVVRTFQVKGQHVGIDFAAPTGTPVVAVADGEISFAGWRGGYGNLVLVSHANDLNTYYAHLSAFAPGMQPGTPVRRGQVIGQVGSTGFSTGPHLHFEIRKGDRYIDPARADVQLPEWTLQAREQPALLMRLLQLGSTRERSLAAVAPPAVRLGASAPLEPPTALQAEF